jgi:hypothetical protein
MVEAMAPQHGSHRASGTAVTAYVAQAPPMQRLLAHWALNAQGCPVARPTQIPCVVGEMLLQFPEQQSSSRKQGNELTRQHDARGTVVQTHVPLSHSASPAQLPHDPPQPSGPQTLPTQFGVQMQMPS